MGNEPCTSRHRHWLIVQVTQATKIADARMTKPAIFGKESLFCVMC